MEQEMMGQPDASTRGSSAAATCEGAGAHDLAPYWADRRVT